jgi:ADP-heptose:LPS heptosyltransferase
MASASQAAFLPELPASSRILIVRLRSLGDAVLTTPALRALKRWRHDLRLSILLYPRFAPVLAGNPNLEEIIELDPSGPGGPLRVLQTVAELRRRGFAAAFNLHGGTLSALLTRLSGARWRAGFHYNRFQFAYNAVADAEKVMARGRLHSVEHQIALFYAAGLPPREIPALEVFPQPEARAAIRQRLAQRGLAAGARYAVIHPVGTFFTKEWPFERYGELARWLEAEHGLAPVVLCGRGESAKADAVARGYGKALVRLEDLPVTELVALLEGAALVVGNDSGPAHIGTALERPLVVLFGSSDAAAWRPWSHSPAHAIVQNPYACNPCRGDRCYAFAQPECILSITPEQVRAAVERVLAPAGVARMA